MSMDFLKQLGLFVVFVLIQTMVLGRIHLFDYATPLLYVYFVAMFPRNYPKWAILLWSFALGLTIDIFSNTPGLAAASLTLIGAIQPYYFKLFVSHDAAEDLRPSLSSIGSLKYTNYIVVLVLLYSLVFHTLEMFSFFNWLHWLMCVVGSTIVTLALIFTFEVANRK